MQTAMAEIKTFSKEYTYEASELDSKVTSRANALEQAKRMLLEELGVFLTSNTEVVNSQLTKDQITSMTAGIVSAIVVDEKWDGHKYWLKAQIEADPSVVMTAIEVLRTDTKKTAELENAKKRLDQLTKDLEAVKKDLAATPKERQERYTRIVNQRQSVDWLIEFFKLFDSKKDLKGNKEALDALEKAIEVAPVNYIPYVMRAAVYGEVAKDYQRAIEDMNKGIKLFSVNPDGVFKNAASLYEGRAVYYIRQAKLNQAVSDLIKALEIDPDDILMSLGSFSKADIETFVKKLPKDYRPYIIRARFNSHFTSGSDYNDSNIYDSAIADVKKSLKLKPNNQIAYYLLTEAYQQKARRIDVKLVDKVDPNAHNFIVDAATKGLKVSTDIDWKIRFLKIRAQQYLVLKKYELAIKDFDSRITINPDDAGAYHDRAIAFKELKKFDNAIDNLTKAIGMKHDGINWPQSAYEVRALVYTDMKKFKEAIDDYTSAFNIWEKAFGALNKEHKLGSGVAYDILTKRADLRRKLGNYTEAIADYRLASEWGGESFASLIFTETGNTYMEMDKPEEALAEYDKAFQLHNNSEPNRDPRFDLQASDLFTKKANAYARLEKADKAIENYKLALSAIEDIKPLYKEELYRELGLYYFSLGIKTEAVKMYREAVRNGEEEGGKADYITYSFLATAELENDNTQAAFQIYNKLFKLYPKTAGTFVARGNAYIKLGNYRSAIDDYSKAIDAIPTNSYAYFQRAVTYIKYGQDSKGIKDLQVAARLGYKDAQNALKENSLAW
jgi:tetratricopeptide (TPR) repeat protein